MSTPRVTELDYLPDTPRRFEALARLPWCALLDSGKPGSAQGRYDILTADPYVTLTTRGALTEIRTRTGVCASARNPLELLREQLGPRTEAVADLPFAGGGIGYFSYDLGRRFEVIPELAARDIDMPDMAIGVYDWVVIVDHEHHRAWMVGQGRDDKTFDEWQTRLDALQPATPPGRVRSLGVLSPAGPMPVQPFTVLSPISSSFDRSSYEAAFRAVKRHIRLGDCYQVNLTQRFSARVHGDPWEAYLQLRDVNPAPFSAFLRIPDGAVLSSSPERFLRVQGEAVETKPIKGTRPRSVFKGRDRALAEALSRSAKDRAENVMIVDLLRNDLGRSCVPGTISVPRLFEVETFASVHHLVSTVVGHLARDKDALDLLAGCFPGGSITGAPKVRAMEIIEALEPHRRSVYCGSVGYLGFDGNMDSNIAIRTLVCHGDHVYAWAGGGIVADSEAEAEYQESLDKAAALLSLLTGEQLSVIAS